MAAVGYPPQAALETDDGLADDRSPPLRVQEVEAKSAAMKQPIVSCSPDVMGGTALFHGTRVPVQTPLDYLEAG